jgi:hypothetical protein
VICGRVNRKTLLHCAKSNRCGERKEEALLKSSACPILDRRPIRCCCSCTSTSADIQISHYFSVPPQLPGHFTAVHCRRVGDVASVPPRRHGHVIRPRRHANDRFAALCPRKRAHGHRSQPQARGKRGQPRNTIADVLRVHSPSSWLERRKGGDRPRDVAGCSEVRPRRARAIPHVIRHDAGTDTVEFRLDVLARHRLGFNRFLD